MTAYGRLCIVVNRSKNGAEALAYTLKEAVAEIGVNATVILEHPIPHGLLAEYHLCCVIGGDGSILGVAPEAIASRVPVMGINLGKLGFMATSSAENAVEKLLEILQGKTKQSERSPLKCTMSDGQEVIAVNDIVFKSDEGNRLIELEVFADGKLVTQYYSDGLVFSTPTGSTAYNLSAGGPLIDSEAEIIAMTPICPHTLSNRSVVFGAGTMLSVRIKDNGVPPQVTIDGRVLDDCRNLFPIEVGLCKEKLTLVHSLDYSSFDVVRNKLGWDH